MSGLQFVTPGDSDVCTSLKSTTHPGTILFRKKLMSNVHVAQCSNCENKDTAAAEAIVDELSKMNPPARFLEKDEATGRWYQISNKRAIQKTKQSLCDILRQPKMDAEAMKEENQRQRQHYQNPRAAQSSSRIAHECQPLPPLSNQNPNGQFPTFQHQHQMPRENMIIAPERKITTQQMKQRPYNQKRTAAVTQGPVTQPKMPQSDSPFVQFGATNAKYDALQLPASRNQQFQPEEGTNHSMRKMISQVAWYPKNSTSATNCAATQLKLPKSDLQSHLPSTQFSKYAPLTYGAGPNANQYALPSAQVKVCTNYPECDNGKLPISQLKRTQTHLPSTQRIIFPVSHDAGPNAYRELFNTSKNPHYDPLPHDAGTNARQVYPTVHPNAHIPPSYNDSSHRSNYWIPSRSSRDEGNSRLAQSDQIHALDMDVQSKNTNPPYKGMIADSLDMSDLPRVACHLRPRLFQEETDGIYESDVGNRPGSHEESEVEKDGGSHPEGTCK